MTVDEPIKLINNEQVDKAIFLILDGEANVGAKKSKSSYGTGHLIGEFAYFLSSGKRVSEVYCEKGSFLVIKESAVNRLAKDYKEEYIDFLNYVIANLIYKARDGVEKD